MRAVLVLCAVAGLAFGRTAPDQVLVLYNADWTEDLEGTAPGQDSLEVARYYVARRTDPGTGKKPHLLGLRCKEPKARRLDQMRLPEGSNDNQLGLRRAKGGSRPQKLPYSARHLVVFSPYEHKRLDPGSLTIRASASGEEADAAVVYADGAAKPGYDIRQVEVGTRYIGYGFASRKAFPDGFTAWVEAKARDGKSLCSYQARFAYVEQFEADRTGADGVRDDAHYLADVQDPVRGYLEDPEHALPGGTLLRDHIVYIVVCYGLPKQVESLYGVARGARGSSVGDRSSLEARLALLYHNAARYHQPIVAPFVHGRVKAFSIASRLRLSLVGANPFRHPMTHTRRKGKGLVGNRLYQSYDYEARRIPHFTPAVRRRLGDRVLYGATRIDGRHPEIAKAQVDGALYGERHLTQELGWFWHGTFSSAPQAAAELEFLGFRGEPPAQPRPWQRGRVLFYFGDLNWGTACATDPGKPPVPYWRGFYPGSVGYAVRSGLGWQLHRHISQLYHGNNVYPERMIDAGVTASATSAGGSHETSATWPDEQVLFHHLLRGYELGEAFLMSGIYLDWVLSLIGDPLYRPALRDTEPDTTPPRVARPADIAVELGKADGRYWARVRPTLAAGHDNPEMTDIAVAYWRSPDDRHSAADWRFSRRPVVVLPDLEPNATYHYDLVLTDPYGNRFSSAKALGDLTIATGPPPPGKRVLLHWREGREAERSFALGGQRPALLPDRGELHVELTAQRDRFDILIDSTRTFVLCTRYLSVGGRSAAACPPPGKRPPSAFTPGRRYRLVARWRRDPVVRQMALVARDGREFELGSNNRLCWLPETLGPRLLLRDSGCTIHRLTIYDDTRPRALDPLYPPHFDLDGFHAADGVPAPKGAEGAK